jgi:hypothetical protein
MMVKWKPTAFKPSKGKAMDLKAGKERVNA